MTRLVARHVLLLALAFAVSWWVVFSNPPPLAPHPPQVPDEILVALAPFPSPSVANSETVPAERPPNTVPEAEPASLEDQPEDQPEEAPPPAPPPAELGSPTAEEESSPAASSPPETRAEAEDLEAESVDESHSLMEDPELLAVAALEVEGRGRKGFTTELIATPEDQIRIARAFDEELVLVPFRSMAPETQDPVWYRIALAPSPRIERVNGRPPLSSYRQYRDLFDYEYSRLPAVVRELRRAVLSRGEVYLFAALIPPREWALVIGRRREALDQSGRSLDDVRSFRIRYRESSDASFDVEVVEILFADGIRFRPPALRAGVGVTLDHVSRNPENSQ